MDKDEKILKAVEYLEQSKDEIYSLRVEAEENEDWDTEEKMNHFIERIQELIDELTPEEELVMKLYVNVLKLVHRDL